MLIYNDDSTQALGNLRPGHARRDLEEWIGWIMDTPVDTYVCHAASPDICFYNTRVGERFGARLNQKWNDASLWMMAQAMQELADEGTDQLLVQAKVAHAHGRRFLAAMRMSDAHYAWGAGSLDDPMFPEFVHNNPQWRIRKPDNTLDFCMDYSVPEVRAHRLAILKELAVNYPIDGFELDFMRFCRHFPTPATSEHIEDMTQFLREARMLCQAQNREMTIGARVPSTLAECAPHGLDPESWAREGLVDYLNPCQWLYADFSIPLLDYLAVVEGTGCRVLFPIQPRVACTWAGGECLSYDRTFPFGMAEFRALAATGYAAGAHGLHFFNVCCELPGRREEMQAMIRDVATRDKVLSGERHYQYLPADPPDADCMTGFNRWQRLHFTQESSSPQTFYFQCGEPHNTKGKITWRIFGAVPQDRWTFKLNGQELKGSQIRDTWMGMSAATTRPGAGLGAHMLYEIDVDIKDQPSLGLRNSLEITPVYFFQASTQEREMKILEVWIDG